VVKIWKIQCLYKKYSDENALITIYKLIFKPQCATCIFFKLHIPVVQNNAYIY
jgi:hypothetical protein